MDNKDDFFSKKEKKNLKDYYDEDEEEKRKHPSFILLCLILSFGIFVALGLSFAAIKFVDSNQTINTLISRITGDDNRDKYIITYIENGVDHTTDGKKVIKDGKIHIEDAKFLSSTNGGQGEVKYFKGLFLTTKNTFTSSKSTITYQVTIKNDSSNPQTFYGLIYDKGGDVKYTVSGIKNGDRVAPGETITLNLTVEYNGKASDKFPTTIDSSLLYNFQEDEPGLHITNADYNKDKSKGGSGEVVNFEGLALTTKNTFNSSDGTITYQVTIKNDSSAFETFRGLNYNEQSGVQYSFSGIKEGVVVAPGQSVTFDLIVKYNGDANTNFPQTIESTVNCNFQDEGIHITDAKYDKNKSSDGAKGEVEYFEGLLLTTKNTFENPDSKVAYEVTIKNSSGEPEIFDGLIFDPNGDVKYTVEGIKEGDILGPGEEIKVYVIVENNDKSGNDDFPKTIESSMSFDFSRFSVTDESNGIYLLNQYPTKDEVGKLFEGTNYVFKWTLMVGKKTKGAYYEITAVPDKNNNLNPSYVKIYLQKNDKDVDFSYKNNKVKVFTDYLDSEHEEAEGKVIYKGNITDEDVKNGKIDFAMRMWVSEDVKINENNMDQFNNKKFSVKVNVYAQFEGENNG